MQFEKEERIDSLTEDGELMLTLLASFAQEEIRSLSDNVKWVPGNDLKKVFPMVAFKSTGTLGRSDHLVVHEGRSSAHLRQLHEWFISGNHREAACHEEMGVKSYKNQHFGNTSIRQILGNITYTGNLLFQKEYVQDPISKKAKLTVGSCRSIS